jgi:hypothetical protein
VDDEHRAGGAFSAVGADRSEQQSGETSVTAASEDQHQGALAGIEQHSGRISFWGEQLQDSWTVRSIRVLHRLRQQLASFLVRVPFLEWHRHPSSSDSPKPSPLEHLRATAR